MRLELAMVMVSLVMNGIGMMMMGLTKHPELALVILILQKETKLLR